jgi:DNA-directed RNA polymerase subunit RPC12/RpoP
MCRRTWHPIVRAGPLGGARNNTERWREGLPQFSFAAGTVSPFARLHGSGIMRRKRTESESGPATLGTTARAHLLLHVRCKECRHQADIDPGEQALRYGADLLVPEWASRLACSQCGSRRVDVVVTPRSTGGVEDR